MLFIGKRNLVGVVFLLNVFVRLYGFLPWINKNFNSSTRPRPLTLGEWNQIKRRKILFPVFNSLD